MKIAVVSDSHDNLANFKKAIASIKKEGIRLIIHCGDVSVPATLKEVLKDYTGRLHLVFGNVDGDHFRMTKMSFTELPQLRIWGELGELKIDKKKIAFTHFPKFAKGLAASQEYDLVFYGHTHKPWEEKIDKTRLINPGNLAGLFYPATFALYNTKSDKLELKILDILK